MLVIKESNPQYKNQRNFTNKPELRFTNIVKQLEKSGYKIIENDKLMTINELKSLQVHSSDMIDFLSNCYESYSNYLITSPNDDTFGNLFDGIVPYNITNSFDKKRISKLEYFRQIGFYCNDLITPIFSNTFAQVLSYASNGFVVPDYIKQGHNLIYCANINPGHHAQNNKYGGYCYLNNGSICTKSLLDDIDLNYKKIAILDLDYHAGDGTAQIFESDPNVLTISIHINPLYDYPFYAGYQEENTASNINLTFEPECNISQYLDLIRISMEKINQFDPDALIIAFGGDTYKNDLDALEPNRTQIDIQDYKKISSQIYSSWINESKLTPKLKPIVITQEGGYNMENIGQIVESFLLGFDLC
jgi:acetoin utilization deacetylase AcuC-like enzyme